MRAGIVVLLLSQCLGPAQQCVPPEGDGACTAPDTAPELPGALTDHGQP